MIENLTTVSGVDISRFMLVEEVEKPYMPPRNYQQQEVPGADGAHVFYSGLKSFEIALKGRLRVSSLGEIVPTRENLKQALSSVEPQRVVFPDDRTRAYLCVVNGGDKKEDNPTNAQIEITFMVCDPIAYGAHHTKECEKVVRLRVGGTYPTRPIIKATPQTGANAWEIRSSTGAFVRIEHEFTGASEIILNMADERATLNGYDVPITLTSDFFSVKDGDTLTASTPFFIEWDERYL